MERFFGALSVTVLLSGLAAVAQIQPAPNPIDQAVQAGLMTPESEIASEANTILSRAELASILVKTFRLDQRQPVQQVANTWLQDVAPSYWAYQDIQIVLHNGIMQGYRTGRFYPEQRITRAEAFSIFAQAYGVFQFPKPTVDQVLSRYPDAQKIPSWARKPLATALHEGFVNTKPGDRIDPLGPMTRSDMDYALSIYIARENFAAPLSRRHKNWLGS
jgi:S-layer homology domain